MRVHDMEDMPSQRAAYAEKLATATQGDSAAIRSGTNSYHILSRRQAASRMGVGVNQVAQARRIRRTAAPEVMQAVLADVNAWLASRRRDAASSVARL